MAMTIACPNRHGEQRGWSTATHRSWAASLRLAPATHSLQRPPSLGHLVNHPGDYCRRQRQSWALGAQAWRVAHASRGSLDGRSAENIQSAQKCDGEQQGAHKSPHHLPRLDTIALKQLPTDPQIAGHCALKAIAASLRASQSVTVRRSIRINF